MTNITQELNTARAYFVKGLECLNNVEAIFGLNLTTTKTGTTGPNAGVVTMSPRRGTITPAGRRKIAKAQKARWAAKNAVGGIGNHRVAV